MKLLSPLTSLLLTSLLLHPHLTAGEDHAVLCPVPSTITPAYGFGASMNHTLLANEPGVHYAFFCTTDFTIKPDGDPRVCQDDGSWSGVDQTCELNDDARCDDPSDLLPDHSTQDNVPAFYRIFHVVELSCEEGYVPRGNSTVQCNFLRVWQIDFECKPACPELTLPPNSAVRSDWSESGFAVGEVVPVSCAPGYHLLGVPEISCSTEGEWDIKFGCCSESENRPALKSFQKIYKENSIIIFGPLLFLLLLLNAALVALIIRNKKRSRSCSKIQVSPAKTPESVHRDFRISVNSRPSPPLSIRDIRPSQGGGGGLVVNNPTVTRDSSYAKLPHEQSTYKYNNQYDYRREESF